MGIDHAVTFVCNGTGACYIVSVPAGGPIANLNVSINSYTAIRSIIETVIEDAGGHVFAFNIAGQAVNEGNKTAVSSTVQTREAVGIDIVGKLIRAKVEVVASLTGKIIHILLENRHRKVYSFFVRNIQCILRSGIIICITRNVQNRICVTGQIQQWDDLYAFGLCVGNDLCHLSLGQITPIAAAILSLVSILNFILNIIGCIGGVNTRQIHIIQDETQAIVSKSQLYLIVAGSCRLGNQCLDPAHAEVLTSAVQMNNPMLYCCCAFSWSCKDSCRQ